MAIHQLKPAVFLDRDGVLNLAEVRSGRPFPPADADSLTLAPMALEGLLKLKEAGFLLICVTNQPDVSRGTRTIQNVTEMNYKVLTSLPLDDLYTCFHDDHDNCDCRKPKPGMLLAAAQKWGIDLGRSFMVGDRKGDIRAGQAAGTQTLFLDFKYAEGLPIPPADFVCNSLEEAINLILKISSNFWRDYNEF
ncbi:MAG: HAD-IIIA family hydrolase [Deltaproteobacteria bacterium]|jgi:D-glycero-D-manno-heptose 1,7-bisphosphate phosphatase|nr:HAD-IIIA family hydrolase [Deltaproteobacteria bacterium]